MRSISNKTILKYVLLIRTNNKIKHQLLSIICTFRLLVSIEIIYNKNDIVRGRRSQYFKFIVVSRNFSYSLFFIYIKSNISCAVQT